jgi:murein DD-endopeptidase MepM/ murein hydrolase activator NlpD
MSVRVPAATIAAALLAYAALSLAPALASAAAGSATVPQSTGEPPVVTTPSPEAAPAQGSSGATATSGSQAAPSSAPASGSTGTSTTTTTTTTTTAPAEAAPQVEGEVAQGSSGGPSPAHHGAAPTSSAPGAQEAAAPEGGASSEARAGRKAVEPSAVTPSLPLALQGSIGGVPNFFIEDFQIPPFLLPIFQAAGAAYGIPWQVLAAINEVETDYGRDLSVSSAGAEGWMQFLPSSWAQYGVDANGDGYEDPYNPADAIFAAARYLRAAGGGSDIRSAIFAYNHSQAYVDSVMLRAQLLGGTPAELLGAITGLSEARFPVHAAAHFSDGFPTVTSAAGDARTLVGTAIYAAAGSPVIAVQDGEIVQIGSSPSLGRFVALRDAYGNTYIYAGMGDVAPVYPVLEPHVDSTVSRNIDPDGSATEPAPTGPATAGVQPRSPLSEGAAVSSLALGAAASLEAAPSQPAQTQSQTQSQPSSNTPQAVAPHVEAFSEGVNEVYLHGLRVGSQVIAGTVLGHLGDGAGAGEPHIVFQIRPAGLSAPLIDPKPILDGWVALENSSVFHARGENPFLQTSPTVGQVLLESKQQLAPQVLADAGISLSRCGRDDIREGRVDKRVLAALEYLSVSGLRPTVAGLSCPPSTPSALAANVAAGASSEAVSITAVNGVPVAGHQGPGTIADTTVRKLLMLQGLSRPRQIVSAMDYPGASGAVESPSGADAIRVSFAAPTSGLARIAGVYASALSAAEWTKLIARLGEIPDPTVSSKPSAAAIPDPTSNGEANGDD